MAETNDESGPGAWLQRERERADVSQTEVSSKADIHVGQISRIENGHSGVRRSTLERYILAVNQLSQRHKIDLDEALGRFGYSANKVGETLDIGHRAQVKLADRDLTAQDAKEIAEELSIAYEVIMARRRRRNTQNNE